MIRMMHMPLAGLQTPMTIAWYSVPDADSLSEQCGRLAWSAADCNKLCKPRAWSKQMVTISKARFSHLSITPQWGTVNHLQHDLANLLGNVGVTSCTCTHRLVFGCHSIHSKQACVVVVGVEGHVVLAQAIHSHSLRQLAGHVTPSSYIAVPSSQHSLS